MSDIQVKTANGSDWRESELRKRSPSERRGLSDAFDALTVADCVMGVTLEYRFPDDARNSDGNSPFASDQKLLTTILDKCRKQIFGYLTGRIFDNWDPKEQGKMYQEIVKSLLDPKAIFGTIEASLAGCEHKIACLGLDYTHARVTAKQEPWLPRRCPDHFTTGITGATDWDVYVRGASCAGAEKLLVKKNRPRNRDFGEFVAQRKLLTSMIRWLTTRLIPGSGAPIQECQWISLLLRVTISALPNRAWRSDSHLIPESAQSLHHFDPTRRQRPPPSA